MLFQRSIICRHRRAEATDRKTFETFGHVLPGTGNHVEGESPLCQAHERCQPGPAQRNTLSHPARCGPPGRRGDPGPLQRLAVVAALAAIAAQWPIRLVDIDSVTLRVILPATLAFVLAFAPRPGKPCRPDRAGTDRARPLRRHVRGRPPAADAGMLSASADDGRRARRESLGQRSSGAIDELASHLDSRGVGGASACCVAGRAAACRHSRSC